MSYYFLGRTDSLMWLGLLPTNRPGDIERYLALLTSEHQGKPQLRAWLTAVLRDADDPAIVAGQMDGALDLDTAIGAQLDILGAIVGVARTVTFQPTGSVSPVLDDDTYRIAIQAKIAQNQWDGTITGIQTIWQNLFPLVYLILKDNLDMTMSAIVIGLGSTIEQDLVTHGYIIPSPEGVAVNVTYAANKVFAYDLENTVFGGYDEGYWTTFA